MSWGIVASIGGSLISGYLNNKSQKNAAKQMPGAPQGSTDPAFYDPYSKYRGAAADKLNTLMNDPKAVEGTPSYDAMFQAAQRQAASQGYNGSGNALVAAANAGGAAYQQEFNNLAMLSGANTSPGQAAYMASQQGNQNQQQRNWQQQQNNNMWGSVGNVIGRIPWGSMFGGSGGIGSDSSGIPAI